MTGPEGDPPCRKVSLTPTCSSWRAGPSTLRRLGPARTGPRDAEAGGVGRSPWSRGGLRQRGKTRRGRGDGAGGCCPLKAPGPQAAGRPRPDSGSRAQYPADRTDDQTGKAEGWPSRDRGRKAGGWKGKSEARRAHFAAAAAYRPAPRKSPSSGSAIAKPSRSSAATQSSVGQPEWRPGSALRPAEPMW